MLIHATKLVICLLNSCSGVHVNCKLVITNKWKLSCDNCFSQFDNTTLIRKQLQVYIGITCLFEVLENVNQTLKNETKASSAPTSTAVLLTTSGDARMPPDDYGAKYGMMVTPLGSGSV